MDKFIKRCATFEAALSTLKESIDLATSSQDFPEKILLALRDSKIQRFEYCTDLFWKVLREHLELKLGRMPLIARPKEVLREAFAAQFLSEDEFNGCITIIDDRNRSSHIYDEQTAIEMDNRIDDHYRLLESIFSRIC